MPSGTLKTVGYDYEHSIVAAADIVLVYGWPNGYAFILSFLYPLWSIGNTHSILNHMLLLRSARLSGAFDSTVHISEEATNANVAIPFAIILAATSSSILGWGTHYIRPIFSWDSFSQLRNQCCNCILHGYRCRSHSGQSRWAAHGNSELFPIT